MNTPTIEIPRERWITYFNDLSKLYHGWQVTVELLDRELGDQTEVKDLPLQCLSYERGGSQANDILVEAGDLPMGYTVHHVNRPKVVRAVPTTPGAQTDIEIESEEGYRTLVRIHQRAEVKVAGQAKVSAG